MHNYLFAECSPGKYSAAGLSLCIDCDQGTYSDKPGSSECKLCPIGRVSSNGAAVCSFACAPGTSASLHGHCPGCKAGKYSNMPNSPKCFACPPGKVSGEKSTTCLSECPVGTYSEVGSSACVQVSVSHSYYLMLVTTFWL